MCPCWMASAHARSPVGAAGTFSPMAANRGHGPLIREQHPGGMPIHSPARGLPMNHSAFTIQQAAVIGAGTMGRGIVMSLANAGIQVLWLDNNPQMLAQAITVVAETTAHNLKLGRIDQAQADARLACAWSIRP